MSGRRLPSTRTCRRMQAGPGDDEGSGPAGDGSNGASRKRRGVSRAGFERDGLISVLDVFRVARGFAVGQRGVGALVGGNAQRCAVARAKPNRGSVMPGSRPSLGRYEARDSRGKSRATVTSANGPRMTSALTRKALHARLSASSAPDDRRRRGRRFAPVRRAAEHPRRYDGSHHAHEKRTDNQKCEAHQGRLPLGSGCSGAQAGVASATTGRNARGSTVFDGRVHQAPVAKWRLGAVTASRRSAGGPDPAVHARSRGAVRRRASSLR